MLPVDPSPTNAVITVSETTLNEDAFVEPKVIEELHRRCVPLIVTIVPEEPKSGENDVNVGTGGGGTKLKSWYLISVSFFDPLVTIKVMVSLVLELSCL